MTGTTGDLSPYMSAMLPWVLSDTPRTAVTAENAKEFYDQTLKAAGLAPVPEAPGG